MCRCAGSYVEDDCGVCDDNASNDNQPGNHKQCINSNIIERKNCPIGEGVVDLNVLYKHDYTYETCVALVQLSSACKRR